MTREPSLYRLLLLAGESSHSSWRTLIPPNWDVGVTANIEHARLVLRLEACDVILLANDIPGILHPDDVKRLFVTESAPVVIVADRADDIVLSAVRCGAIWLPAESARQRPELLVAVLKQAMLQPAGPRMACTGECRSRITRLLDLLWQATPGTIPGPWFSQRHMLERLDEEVARTQRDGGPLSLIIGEVQPGAPVESDQSARVREWAAHQIGQHKRRCDVAGQYGLDGFMLVLPRATPEMAGGACRRLRTVLSHPPEGLPPLHVTFGLAGVPGDRPNVPGLLGRAEQRLEEARVR